MSKNKIKTSTNNYKFPKALTGIEGLDELTEGGLPKGRPTLICGGAGCGKTVMGMEFPIDQLVKFLTLLYPSKILVTALCL